MILIIWFPSWKNWRIGVWGELLVFLQVNKHFCGFWPREGVKWKGAWLRLSNMAVKEAGNLHSERGSFHKAENYTAIPRESKRYRWKQDKHMLVMRMENDIGQGLSTWCQVLSEGVGNTPGLLLVTHPMPSPAPPGCTQLIYSSHFLTRTFSPLKSNLPGFPQKSTGPRWQT